MNFNFKKNKLFKDIFLFFIIFLILFFLNITFKYNKVFALGKKNFFQNSNIFYPNLIKRIPVQEVEEKRKKIEKFINKNENKTIKNKEQSYQKTEKRNKIRENFLFGIISPNIG
jgi:predicted negative regulator of RcsB-dependent stress response